MKVNGPSNKEGRGIFRHHDTASGTVVIVWSFLMIYSQLQATPRREHRNGNRLCNYITGRSHSSSQHVQCLVQSSGINSLIRTITLKHRYAIHLGDVLGANYQLNGY